MQKSVYKKVFDRANAECEICGSTYLLELHHAVSGRGKRKKHENEETCFLLCYDCHRGTKGCHGKEGHNINLNLKLMAQERLFDKGYTEDKVREMMGGRLYSGKIIPSRTQKLDF